MRILILGAKGMIGRDLMEEFADDSLVELDKNELDITSQASVEKATLELNPDVIINTAAYTDVDAAEQNCELAMKVNGEAVGYIVEATRKVNAKLIQISTELPKNRSWQEALKEYIEKNGISKNKI